MAGFWGLEGMIFLFNHLNQFGGIAAEGSDILMHPFQRHQLIHKTQVCRVLIILAVLL